MSITIVIARFIPTRLARLAWLDKPVLQEYFFRMSLREAGINYGQIRIDHDKGTCWHKKIGWVPLCFPVKMITAIEKLSKEKTINYFFRGTITKSREWVKKYPNIHSSLRGRNLRLKYSLDLDYYQQLSSCLFSLSPVGDCPWSYRFFESIMCKAIPILGDNEDDIFASSFFFLRDTSEHVYVKNAAEKNFKIFIDNHTLANNRRC